MLDCVYYNVGRVFPDADVGTHPDKVIGFLNLPNPSSHTPGSTQPLADMHTRNIHECEGQLAHKTDIFTATCELIIQKIRELNILQTYGPQQPVSGIVLPSL
jgi:hypothetical protein